jgi:hypothetical protein
MATRGCGQPNRVRGDVRIDVGLPDRREDFLQRVQIEHRLQ